MDVWVEDEERPPRLMLRRFLSSASNSGSMVARSRCRRNVWPPAKWKRITRAAASDKPLDVFNQSITVTNQSGWASVLESVMFGWMSMRTRASQIYVERAEKTSATLTPNFSVQ